MRLAVACATSLAMAIAVAGPRATCSLAAETTTDKPAIQASEDAGLVVFVQPKRVGSRLLRFLYIDDEFVGVLESNSFTYARVEPGRHVLWTFSTVDVKSRLFKKLTTWMQERPWEGTEFKVSPGQTKYFRFGNPDGSVETHLQIDPTEGAERVARVKFYARATEDETETSARHLAERPAEVVEQFEAAYVEVPYHPTPATPADVTGLIHVEANSAVSLELIQNLWSEGDDSGDEVLLRVARDVGTAEGIWLREGTLVRGLLHHVRGRFESRQGGLLEVAVPAVVAVDGTVVPTQGEVERSGGGYSQGDGAAWKVVRGLLVLTGNDFGPTGGRAVFVAMGSPIEIYTRDPVWIAPEMGAVALEEQKPPVPALRLRAAEKTVRFPPLFGSYFEALIGRQDRPTRVAVRSIAGRPPPLEIEPRAIKRLPEGWSCRFDWWQVARFLPFAGESDRVTVELEGVFEDGTSFVVEVPVVVNLQVEG